MPAILPMWRAGSGVELDVERDEIHALRVALARLKDTEEEAYGLVAAFVHGGQGLGSTEDALTVLEALDSLEAYVDEILRV